MTDGSTSPGLDPLGRQVDGADAESGDADLLVLVDTTWTMWGPLRSASSVKEPAERHIKFLRGLLGTAPGSTAVGSDNRASILFDPDLDAVDGLLGKATRADESTARSLLDGARRCQESLREATPGQLPWRDADDSSQVLAHLEVGLKRCAQMMAAGRFGNADLLESLLNLHACRVYLDCGKLARFVGADEVVGTMDSYACLEFRFRRNLGRFWLYVVFVAVE